MRRSLRRYAAEIPAIQASRSGNDTPIRRWNDGFYRYHSLVPNLQDGERLLGISNEDINRALSKAEEKYDLPRMLRPIGLDIDLSDPKDDMSRSTATHLDWVPGEGLRLNGDDWFKPEWHPDRFE